MLEKIILIHPTKCAGTSISKKIFKLKGFSNNYSNFYSGHSFNVFFQKNIALFYSLFYSKHLLSYIFYMLFYMLCFLHALRNLFRKHHFGLTFSKGSCQHFTYKQLKKSNQINNNSICICVVSHPQHRIASSYYFLGYDKHYTFTNFLKKVKDGSLLSGIKFLGFREIIKQHFMPMHSYIINNDNNISVDFTLKSESLQNDWKEVCGKYNLEYSRLEHVNKTKNLNDWKQLYKTYPKAANLVYEIYEIDFKTFNYNII